MKLPGVYGAYPTQRETPYWESPEPRRSKDKIYSQSWLEQHVYVPVSPWAIPLYLWSKSLSNSHRSAQLFEIMVDCAPLSTNAWKNDKVTNLVNESNIQHQGICDRIILR